MTTVTAHEAENPKTAADLDSMSPTTVGASPTQPLPSSEGGGDESMAKPDSLAKASNIESDSVVTDVQKKMKRAERFGMPVQLSEAEKRNTRAERFGTSSAVNGSDSSKQADELKRKARAERFGIAQSAPADEEVKKKARLSRFGAPAQIDSAEEEKKKARAIRFSQLDVGKKSNGKENVEAKMADTGKAGGET